MPRNFLLWKAQVNIFSLPLRPKAKYVLSSLNLAMETGSWKLKWDKMASFLSKISWA